MVNTQLAAICGVYCGGCAFYRAYHDKNESYRKALANFLKCDVEKVECYGCQAPGGCAMTDVFYHRPDCPIVVCSREKGYSYCYECAERPCGELARLKENLMKQVGINILDNLDRMKEIGVGRWLEEQERKWACPSCGSKLTAGDKKCHSCGAKIS